MSVVIPRPDESDTFYICATEGSLEQMRSEASTRFFKHQGTEYYVRIVSIEPLLPLWASIVIICTCLSFSALFSGLNLGIEQ